MSWTIRHENTLTGAAHFRGVFMSREAADARVAELVKGARKFAQFRVWTGTPREYGNPVGELHPGEC